MMMFHKPTGKTFDLTNPADANGICQVIDENNHTLLVRFEELEYWKIAKHKERLAELEEIYQVGTRLENRS